MVIYYICNVISYLIWIYSILLVIDAISVVGRLLNKIIDPYLNLFRRGPIGKLAFSTGIDISPVIGIFILYIIQDLIQNLSYKFI